MWTIRALCALFGVLFSATFITSLATHALPIGQAGNAITFLMAMVSWVTLIMIAVTETTNRRINNLKWELIREIRAHEERVTAVIDNKYSQIDLVRALTRELGKSLSPEGSTEDPPSSTQN